MYAQNKGIAPIVAIIILLLALGGGGAYYAAKKQKERMLPPGKEEVKVDKDKMSKDDTMKKGEITVSMDAQNNTKQSGRATLTDMDGKKTKVVIEVGSGSAGVAQPAHIHMGSCPNPGAVLYPLQNVVNGRSETMLEVSLASLKDKLPLAVNVHKSAAEAKLYMSCGNIQKEAFDKLGNTTMDGGDKINGMKTHKIEMTAAGFAPSNITIKKGEKVEFINRDSKPRWPASGMHPSHLVCRGFDALKAIAPGETYSFSFNEAKACPMHDHLMPNFFGKITVE